MKSRKERIYAQLRAKNGRLKRISRGVYAPAKDPT